MNDAQNKANPTIKIRCLNGGMYRATSDECASVLCDEPTPTKAYDGALRQVVDARWRNARTKQETGE